MIVVVRKYVVRPRLAVVGGLVGTETVAPQPEAGHGSVRVTVPVYGEPAGPTGMVKVCVVTTLPGAVAVSDSV